MKNDPLPRRNIVLIGMPGVGKSTIGVLLAKELSRDFVDTDVMIQAHVGRRLQTLLDDLGSEAFCELESLHVRQLRCTESVIATGGSVVYSNAAMLHLAKNAMIVHLHLPFEPLAKRLGNLPARGVVIGCGQTLRMLYHDRLPLYERYEQRRVDCEGLSHEDVVAAVIRELSR